MTISVYPLTADDIPFLRDMDTLFILDYRALWESLEYEIPAMRKYENLAPWILEEQKILVNENASILNYSNINNLFSINTWFSPKISIIERAEKLWILKNIDFKNIFAFIPHPSIDVFSECNSKILSYTYKDFLLLNNKISQKYLVKYTPKWHIIQNKDDLESIKNKEDFYIKRGLGSWWFTVFKLDTLNENKKFEELLKQNQDLRYIEERVCGQCMSIQLCKTNEDVVIFWLTKQYIKDWKEFYWAQILTLSELTNDTFLKERLLQCITDLFDGLLWSYNGFFGIDFIYDKEKKIFGFLEWNIRLTAMTIPTLLHNKDTEYNVFKEDIDEKDLKEKNIILWYDKKYKCYDILTSI